MDNLHCSPESECNSLFSVIKLNAAYLGFLFSANPLGDFFFMPPFTPSQKINKKKTINKTKKNNKKHSNDLISHQHTLNSTNTSLKITY